jgi:hypothetical protein
LAGEFYRYLVFIAIVFMVNVCMGCYIRFIASFAPDTATATPLAGFGTVLLVLFAGYLIVPPVQPFFKPFYWISPIGIGFQALAINEFTARAYAEGGMGELYLANYNIKVSTEDSWVNSLLQLFVLSVVFTGLMGINFARENRDNDTSLARVQPNPFIAHDAHSRRNSHSFSSSFAPQEMSLATERSDLEQKLLVESRDTSSSTALSFKPLTLSFSGLSYSVQAGKASKKILNGIHGYFEPGLMTALMGSTGAGPRACTHTLRHASHAYVTEYKYLHTCNFSHSFDGCLPCAPRRIGLTGRE